MLKYINNLVIIYIIIYSVNYEYSIIVPLRIDTADSNTKRLKW